MPHCGDDIELEDGTSGLFVCPYCDKDFTWNRDVKVIVVDDDLKSKFLVFLFGIFSPRPFLCQFIDTNCSILYQWQGAAF